MKASYAQTPSRPYVDSWLYHFSLLVAAATLFLILAGGLVTSHDAGLAVPDWPTSYGQWFPPMVGNVFWEHGHRMIAGVVGILTCILAVWIQIREERRWMKWLGWIAFAAVILQAVLGGLTVRFMLPPPISIFHACLAQTFLSLIVSIAYFLSPSAPLGCDLTLTPGVRVEGAPLKRLLIMTSSFIYLQLILGAVIRHTGHAVVFHVIVALFVVLHMLLVILRIARLPEKEKFLSNLSLSLGAMSIFQIFLGLGAFIFTKMLEKSYTPSLGEVFFTTAHQTLGASILATAVLLTLAVSR